MCGIGNMAEVIDILRVFGSKFFEMSYFDMVFAWFKMNYGITSKNKIIVHKFIYTKSSSIFCPIYLFMHCDSPGSSKIQLIIRLLNPKIAISRKLFLSRSI